VAKQQVWCELRCIRRSMGYG